jgi:hypothetical protein
MQRPVPFQPWDNLRDDDQMRQSSIGAGLPGVTAHLHHLASGHRHCRVQDGDRCPLQDMREALSHHGNRIYNAWEIRTGFWLLSARFHNVKHHTKATGLARMHNGQIYTL